MLQLRTDLDAAHTVASIVAGVARLVEQRRALILYEMQFLIAVDDLEQLFRVDILAIDIVVGTTLQTPHAYRIVRRAGHKAILRQRLGWFTLQIIWHSLHAPNARGVIEE